MAEPSRSHHWNDRRELAVLFGAQVRLSLRRSFAPECVIGESLLRRFRLKDRKLNVSERRHCLVSWLGSLFHGWRHQGWRDKEGPLRVAVVGQVPPPVGGQAVMIAALLQQQYEQTILRHVEMRFSRTMLDMGTFRVIKILELAKVILRIVWVRARYRTNVLYYPPAGSQRLPMYRDFMILILTRWMFRLVIFHFHAGGLSDAYACLRWWEKSLFELAYRRPAVGIRTAPLAPPDAAFLEAERDIVVYNGLPDVAPKNHRTLAGASIYRILYVGVLKETKGIMELLQAASLLREARTQFEVRFVGEFDSGEFATRCIQFVERQGLQHQVLFLGPLFGRRKELEYQTAGVFCFPSYFESETSGLVLIEAMMHGLPTVASTWRGIPSLVVEEVTGLLVPPRDAEALAEKLRELMEDPRKREQLGRNARLRYEEMFTLDRFEKSMEKVFLSLRHRNT